MEPPMNFDDFIWIRGQGDYTRPEEEADVKATWRDESEVIDPRRDYAEDD